MSVTLRDLCTFRSAIMGMAIILIMGYHSGVVWHGRFGVEIFLIMSGIGINCSLAKNPKISDFYFKRTRRIFPCYFLCGTLFYLLIMRFSSKDYLLAISTYSFWVLGIKYAWYIPVIYFYYLISPIFYRLSEKYICVLILWLIIFLCFFNEMLPDSIAIMLRRLPSYLIGFAISKTLLKGSDSIQKVFNLYFGILMLVSGYVCLIAMKFLHVSDSFFLVIPYVITALGVSHIVIVLCKHSLIIKKFLEAFGAVSLELYLTHEFFLLIPLRPFIDNQYVLFVITVPLAYNLALFIHNGLMKITTRM